jgi:hypothetical protein
VDIQRIRTEVSLAMRSFALVEAYPTVDGGVYVKAGLQTSAGNAYIASLTFLNYPSQMPRVEISKPTLPQTPHRYNGGHICYLHPNMWNPGRHNIEFVLARTAKWLNKYEVWRATGRWPGAQLQH